MDTSLNKAFCSKAQEKNPVSFFWGSGDSSANSLIDSAGKESHHDLRSLQSG
ncbi:MAG: hypothetical protein Q4A06_04175 [Cardiobacteriaceae bacterium]|nr:hypothetical protein [Cardiobacteriaceae bacterium]